MWAGGFEVFIASTSISAPLVTAPGLIEPETVIDPPLETLTEPKLTLVFGLEPTVTLTVRGSPRRVSDEPAVRRQGGRGARVRH